jgi:hypothetical protein
MPEQHIHSHLTYLNIFINLGKHHPVMLLHFKVYFVFSPAKPDDGLQTRPKHAALLNVAYTKDTVTLDERKYEILLEIFYKHFVLKQL